jgi:nucleoside-diphosphate-sugar epimerase
LVDVVLSALDRAVELGGDVPALLLLSHTAVYGVAAGSPLVFDERSHIPRETIFESAFARWAETLRAVERKVVIWAVSAGVRVGVLRTASVLAGPVDSPVAALLRAAFPVRVFGYDPPCQAIHYDDLVTAVALAIDQKAGEVLNIVGLQVLPLSRLLAMAGVFAPALPGPLADRLAPAAVDGAHLRWRTLADGRRATALLGFMPRKSLEDCLRD